VISTAEYWIYAGTLVALVAAGLGFPIPEEIPIVTAGVLAGQSPDEHLNPVAILAVDPTVGFPGVLPWAALAHPALQFDDSIRVRWWILLPICIFGVVFSDSLLYGLGRLFGTRLLNVPFVARMMPPEKRQRIERNFHEYGVKILLFARMLPGIRAPIFITAGTMRLPLKRFVVADGIYAIPGVSLLFFLAFWFTNSFKEIVERAEAKVIQVRHVLVVVAIIGVAIYFIIHFWRKPFSTGDPTELPIIGPKVAHATGHAESNGEVSPQALPKADKQEAQQS
jgi:membrane protein DedA with SNARE-associated domain